MEPSRQFPGRTQHTTAVHFGQHLGWKQLESRVLIHKNSQWQWQAICCPAFACVAASKRQRWFLVAQSIRTYLAVSTVATGNPSVDDTASESRFSQPTASGAAYSTEPTLAQIFSFSKITEPYTATPPVQHQHIRLIKTYPCLSCSPRPTGKTGRVSISHSVWHFFQKSPPIF